MIINLDIDGVLRDVNPIYLALYRELHNHFYSAWNFLNHGLEKIMDEDSNHYFFKTHIENIFYHSKPTKHSEYVNSLRKQGHIIQLTSAQLKGTEDMNISWLNKNNLEFDEIFFLSDKSKIDGDIIVDDYPYNLSQSNCWLKICMDKFYNQKWNGPRIHDLKKLYDIVQCDFCFGDNFDYNVENLIYAQK